MYCKILVLCALCSLMHTSQGPRYRQYNWESIVDYTVLDSQWHANARSIYCSAAGGGSTKECWQTSIRTFLVADHNNILNSVQRCIGYYAEDFAAVPPRNRFAKRRGKRAIPLTTSSHSTAVVIPYSDCVSSSVIDGTRRRLNFESLSNFINKNTKDSCESVQLKDYDSNLTWPYKFVALSRLDSPLRTPLDRCGIHYFPPDPYWSTWSGWGFCPRGCGRRSQIRRTRSCRNGSNAQRQSTSCSGSKFEIKLCPYRACPTSNPCAKQPLYSNWSTWSTCSSNCRQERERHATCYSQNKAYRGTQGQGKSCTGGYCQHRGYV